MESYLCSLDQDAIKKFQEGKLSENEEEWHRLVDPEARASLDPKEVKRQSVIFEVIKSEKDYVADLEILQDVSILLSHSTLSLLCCWLFAGCADGWPVPCQCQCPGRSGQTY
jgi:hypothetical protein